MSTGIRDARDLGDRAVALARRWRDASFDTREDSSTEHLRMLLRDPRGLTFAVGFIDGVIRPDDHRVAARRWAEVVAEGVPDSLPRHLRLALRAGARTAVLAPDLVVPLAVRALRGLVGHLVVDASDRGLERGLARLHADGMRPNVNLLGEAVLGRAQARARLDQTFRILHRHDVDHLSIKVSSVVAPHSSWAFEEIVEEVTRTLLPLYRAAARSTPQTFINLDMEEYRDLDLTIAVFMALLEHDELLDLSAGIVLQAYLPDSLPAMRRLHDWAAQRCVRGGAPIKVRLVKGANLPMERVKAQIRGWPLATWSTKQETDTQYLRIIEESLTPERVRSVRLGVAGHNLFDLAWAWTLAVERGVTDGVEFEMLLGMSPALARTIRAETGSMTLYTPAVHASEFDVAIAYLVRRLEEGAAPENYLASMADPRSAVGWRVEQQRFLQALAGLADAAPQRRRDQDRNQAPENCSHTFANTPDTDPSLPHNRAWARAALAGATADLGADIVRAHTVTDPDALDELIGEAHAAGGEWGALPAGERSAILRRAGDELQRARGDLIAVMASECGKTVEQSDPEVSEAVDFAHWYADRAEALALVDGALAVPRALTVVTPPWNFPVAIPAGSTLAALAAGSAVILKPARQAALCGSLLAEALWRAGVPREVLRLVHASESGVATRLITDPRVAQVVLTGAYETAELFTRLRPGLRLLAETSGKNAMVVTPAADFDLTVRDLVASAFGHAGQKCSAASLGILVGSVGESGRFLRQLKDATESLVVGVARDPISQMGPLIAAPEAKLLRGLTELGPGEEWLVRPERLDDSGRLWSPGIRTGVRLGSEFHRTEYFGPVLGLMHAADLGQAIQWQNAVDYGLTAGLHTLDVAEQREWLASVQAGNLYVNRGTTGAIVRRQPFGGWKKSVVGAGQKAGGPHALFGLVDWRPVVSDSTPAPTAAGAELAGFAAQILAADWSAEDRAELRRALLSDEAAWRVRFGRVLDVTGLEVETNALRYLPASVTIRAEAGTSVRDLARVLAAGLRSGADLRVSAAQAPVTLRDLGARLSVVIERQDAEAFRAGLRAHAPDRIRLIGATPDEADALATLVGPATAVIDHAVTSSGEVEVLPFLREQAVSITQHRFGTPLVERALRLG